MSKVDDAIYEIHHMDEIAARDQWMNRIHPLVKFVLTVFYIALVVSFSKYDIVGLFGMIVYLIFGFYLAELSVKKCFRKLRVVLPFVCMVGLANPFFDKNYIIIGSFTINAGIISMLTMMMKGIFSVMASYLLIATTTIEKICYALSLLHLPKILITQIMLTYRYITLLLDEVNRITQAYALRAPGQKGIHYKVWGTLTGQLLLRSADRANAVFESMTLRGYQGEFSYVGSVVKWKKTDVVYLVCWSIGLLFIRSYPIIMILGNLFT